MNHELSAKTLAFCRHYVELREGKAAAIKAGFSVNGAKQQAYILLRDERVKAEIARLEAAYRRLIGTRITQATAGAPPPPEPPDTPGGGMDGEIMPPGLIALAEAEANAILNRAWVVDRLMKNARIALGEEATVISRVVKVKGTLPQDGSPGTPDSFVAQEIKVFERDPAAANRALELLGDEVTRMEAAGQQPTDSPTMPAITRNTDLADAYAGFVNIRDRMKAKAATNGTTNGSPSTNGKAH